MSLGLTASPPMMGGRGFDSTVVLAMRMTAVVFGSLCAPHFHFPFMEYKASGTICIKIEQKIFR